VAKTIAVTVRRGVEESNTINWKVTASQADPTSSWTKAEIVEWLVAQGVSIGDDAVDNFTKAELLDIVAAYLNGDPVDDLLGG
jgi:hypothetical protein